MSGPTGNTFHPRSAYCTIASNTPICLCTHRRAGGCTVVDSRREKREQEEYETRSQKSGPSRKTQSARRARPLVSRGCTTLGRLNKQMRSGSMRDESSISSNRIVHCQPAISILTMGSLFLVACLVLHCKWRLSTGDFRIPIGTLSFRPDPSPSLSRKCATQKTAPG